MIQHKIRNILIPYTKLNLSVEFVITGSFANNTFEYDQLGLPQSNSDLDLILVCRNPISSRLIRKILIKRFNEIKIYASIKIRPSYRKFNDTRKLLTMHEYDELLFGLPIYNGQSKLEIFRKNNDLQTLKVHPFEFWLLAINRYFEILDEDFSSKSQRKFQVSLDKLNSAMCLNIKDFDCFLKFVNTNSSMLKNFGYHNEYSSLKKKILWFSRTLRLTGYPINTLHIYYKFIVNPLDFRPKNYSIKVLTEWKKGHGIK